jgi:hypothetical protein
MGTAILAVMLRYWPNFNAVKQMAFLKLIAVVLRSSPICQFAALVPATISLVARCISGPAHKPADRALHLVLRGAFDFLLRQGDRRYFTKIYSAVLAASRRHWDADIRQLTTGVLAYLSKWDPVVSRCLDDAGTPRPGTARDDPKTHRWTVISQVAARNNPGLKLGTKQAEIMRTFHIGDSLAVQETAPARRRSLENSMRKNTRLWLPSRTPIIS